jgi:hypothetical protein
MRTVRSLQYVAFGVAFLAASACAAKDEPPPPFPSSGALTSGGASADDEASPEDTSDPGSGEPTLAPSQGAPLDPAACSVTFTKDVLPKIRDQFRCGASGCHSAPLAAGAKTVMDTTNADATYALLTTAVHGGKKLVDTSSTSPSDSSLWCLMQGTCGARMPRQGVDAFDLALVESWLECKAPRGTSD